MAEYESLEEYCRIYRTMHGPGSYLWLGMFIVSTDYEHSDIALGRQLIADSIGYADIPSEDIYGRALMSGNAYDDIEKNEELGAKLLIDATERGCAQSLYAAGLCLIAGIGVEQDLERADRVKDAMLNSINAKDDVQEREIDLKIANSQYQELLKVSYSYQLNPGHIEQAIREYFHNEGARIRNNLVAHGQSTHFFQPEIAAQYHFDEFGPYDPAVDI